ncbi:MAG TPA: hypothetical protein VH163_08000 [Gemmatimonadales bacterium]|nr:hypothetical protein [Gemmatimonadales bacterium]
MNTRLLVLALAGLTVGAPLTAQRPFRIGPVYSSLSLQDANGASHQFTAFGGTLALLTADDDETGLSIVRYNDLATSSSCPRNLTFFGLDDNYFPVGPSGIAPFASTEVGVARVLDSDKSLGQELLGLPCSGAQTTTQIGFGFGLGLRVTAGKDASAQIEGRFFQVPQSAIQALEVRANVSLLLGTPRVTQLTNGTLGPALAFVIPISGPLKGRAPFLGVRFRRDTKKASSVLGLEVDWAPLQITGTCPSTGCNEDAVLFQPGYEASYRPSWGRIYGELGPVLAGFFSQGPDRGVAQGAQGGFGVEMEKNGVLYNFSSRLLWFQPGSGGNVFGVQLGVSVGPAIRH